MNVLMKSTILSLVLIVCGFSLNANAGGSVHNVMIKSNNNEGVWASVPGKRGTVRCIRLNSYTWTNTGWQAPSGSRGIVTIYDYHSSGCYGRNKTYRITIPKHLKTKNYWLTF